MTDQQKEKHATRIIDAVIRLKEAIDQVDEGAGLIEITVNHRAKHAIDYIFYEMSSFYLSRRSIHSELEFIAGVKLSYKPTNRYIIDFR